MTDGQASHPTEGIKQLQNLQGQFPGKLKFSGIEFGSGVAILKNIAFELGGTSDVAYNIEQLVSLFKRSIEVIEYREKKWSFRK